MTKPKGGYTPERTQARVERIRHGGRYPQFGHAGRHKGSLGNPDCPPWLHHHHDWFCALPTPAEWAAAGRTGDIETGRR